MNICVIYLKKKNKKQTSNHNIIHYIILLLKNHKRHPHQPTNILIIGLIGLNLGKMHFGRQLEKMGVFKEK